MGDAGEPLLGEPVADSVRAGRQLRHHLGFPWSRRPVECWRQRDAWDGCRHVGTVHPAVVSAPFSDFRSPAIPAHNLPSARHTKSDSRDGEDLPSHPIAISPVCIHERCHLTFCRLSVTHITVRRSTTSRRILPVLSISPITDVTASHLVTTLTRLQMLEIVANDPTTAPSPSSSSPPSPVPLSPPSQEASSRPTSPGAGSSGSS